MDKRTRLAALVSLAKSAAEIAADIATATSEAAGCARVDIGEAASSPAVANLIVGNLMPAEQKLEALQAIFRAVHAIHQTGSI
jgi:hypothetical protein